MAINSNIHKMKNINFKYLYIFALQACAIFVIKLILLKAFLKKPKVTNLCEWRKGSSLGPRKCFLGFVSLNLQLKTWQVLLPLFPKTRHELANVWRWGFPPSPHAPCHPAYPSSSLQQDTASNPLLPNSRWSPPMDQNPHTRQNLP